MVRSWILLAVVSGMLLVMGRVFGAAPGGGMVTLPYHVNDGQGNQWVFYQYGQFQQQGNMPVYGQGGMLQISGQYPQGRQNQAKIDEKTGELVLENMPANLFTVTRRILLNKEEGVVRYVDIIRNPQNKDQTVNLVLSTNVNYGIQGTSMVADPKRREQNLAWVAATHANGRVVVEMFGGKGAKTIPTINYVANNNNVQASLSYAVPAGKEIALMHLHYLTTSVDNGTKFVTGLKESKLMATIPPAIRKLIINFRGGENFVGDYEILRGDILDVIELRSGDQLKGTIKEKQYRLQTFYGPVTLSVEKVVGMINVGEYRPRQLLVTADGEIFGGNLEVQKLSLELSSGQVMEVPLSQIGRMGYRKRPGEPDEWVFDKPLVLMRTGDRIGVQTPSGAIEVMTRYGLLKLAASAVAAIDFETEEHGVHEVFLTDGSRFAGLVMAEAFEMKLGDAGVEQAVKFPASSVRRLQLSGKIDDLEDDQATLTLANEDVMVGSITGNLKLDTAFSTMALTAGEIKRMTRTAGSPSDVQVVLWDETTVSGQLQEQELMCRLKSGVTMKVPVALVAEYVQPRPVPSPAVVEGIKGLVVELGADDWKQRDRAQERLTAMGAAVISTLKQLRDQQSPEAQQRIDVILNALEKEGTKEGKGRGSAGAGLTPPVPEVEIDAIPQQIMEPQVAGEDLLGIDGPMPAEVVKPL